MLVATVGDMLREAREGQKKSMDEVARLANINRNTVYNAEAGRVKTSGAILTAISRALGYESFEALKHHMGAKPFSAQHTPNGLIPLFDEVPAGNGDFDPTDLGEDNGYSAKMVSRAIFPGLTHPMAYAVTVRGDSMEPEFYEGETVACIPIGLEDLKQGMYVVFRLADGNSGIKLIEPDVEDAEYAWLIPLNKRHRRQRVRLDEFVNLSHAVFKTIALP